MIKTLRLKLILAVAISLFALLTLLLGSINLINYSSLRKDSDELVSFISKNGGKFPELEDKPEHDEDGRLPSGMSPEVPYESRFFSVILDYDGKAVYVDTRRIASVSDEEAIDYANDIIESGRKKGFIHSYRYLVTADKEGSRITFLDRGRQLDAFRSFLARSITISVIGYAVVLIIIFIVSDRILRPIIEGYKRQKRFIQDAGHELKTPLTVISANADLLEMELGENEGIDEIRTQVKRMGSLTHELITLARLEGAEKDRVLIDFPLSEVVEEAINSFTPIAETEEKTFVTSIQKNLSLKGEQEEITKLVTIILDNAIKYSPKRARINIELKSVQRGTTLTVTNTTGEPVEQKTLSRVFDRFFRQDSSRNSEAGGYGIGLSVAKAIVIAHGGKIIATTTDGSDFTVSAFLPR